MRNFLLICIASLLSVTASAYENGGKQKFERDQFVLAEHGQSQVVEFVAIENLLSGRLSIMTARPIQASTQFLLIDLQSPANYSQNLLKHKDVGRAIWEVDSKYLKEPLASVRTNKPYRNYLRVYPCEE